LVPSVPDPALLTQVLGIARPVHRQHITVQRGQIHGARTGEQGQPDVAAHIAVKLVMIGWRSRRAYDIVLQRDDRSG
jgi:hypothetical protein